MEQKPSASDHAKLLIKRLIDVCHSCAPINSSILFGLVISGVMSIRSAINFQLARVSVTFRAELEPQIRNFLHFGRRLALNSGFL